MTTAVAAAADSLLQVSSSSTIDLNLIDATTITTPTDDTAQHHTLSYDRLLSESEKKVNNKRQ